MRISRRPNECCWRRRSARRLAVCLLLGALSFTACKRHPAARHSTRSAPKEVNAAWYPVPPGSLARRRAGLDELTAAHNKLPIGTRVRVTSLENGKTVTVRITDRGITDRAVTLDLCKQAAEELGMLREGIARVRMEVLPESDRANATSSPR